MFEITFFSALLGGLLTFLAPCTLPLIPGYIAFIGGAKGDRHFRRRIMVNALLFVLGFSVVFITYGMASGVLGKFLILHRATIAAIGGVMVIVLGLAVLGLFTLPTFSALLPSTHGVLRKVFLWGGLFNGSPSGAFLLGFLFALGWSPCLGPILGTILLLAGTTGETLSGGLLLGVYALGLAIPFLFIAFFYGSSFAYMPKLERYLPWVNNIGGVLIVGIGLLLVFGQFGMLNTWAGEILGDRFLNGMVQYM
jgi:cytochrome c-type biogenesis protein